MFRKYLLLFVLILSIALPCAAEGATYFPGEPTQDLFESACHRGDMVLVSAKYDLTTAETAGELYGEYAKTLEAVCEAIKNTTLTVGFGSIENGFRVLLEGDYTAGAENANLNVTIDLTENGILVASSVIPGECVSMTWETLLTLCEIGEEETAAILSMRDADLDAMLLECLEQIEPMLNMLAEISAPYGEIVLEHIAALPIEVHENVPAEAGFPAAAEEIYVQITLKDLGDLTIALCEQIKQDTTLCSILDAMIVSSAGSDPNAPTMQQVCDALIESASQSLTDETMPLHIYIGMDESGNLLYLNISTEDVGDDVFVINYIGGKVEDSDASLISLDVVTINDEQEIEDGISFVTAYDIDENNPLILDLETVLSCYEFGDEILSLTFSVSNESASFGEGPAYVSAIGANLTILDDEEPVTPFAFDLTGTSTALSDGGEEFAVTGTLNLLADDIALPMTVNCYTLAEMTENGPVCTMNNSIQIPEIGIANAGESYTIYTAAKDTAAKTEYAVETTAPEDLEALAGRAMTALEQEISKLLELLPPELTAELSAEDAAIAVIE